MKKVIVIGLCVFALLQLARPAIPSKPPTAEVQAPPEVRRILDKSCYSCHSDERRLSWFDQIVPAYWLVRHDILTARKGLNFSTLGTAPAPAQKARLYEAVNMIQLGAMPLSDFLKLHPDAKVTPEELAALKAYLAPWTETPPVGSGAEDGPKTASLAGVQPEFNGQPFDPSFESWKALSTTDRGDNGTFRFILGNDVAVKAARSGNTSPWPDGARFAKIAWHQETGPDGLVYPGKFVHVELMFKDAARFKNTEGWGWGRWLGADLKPYGTDAAFVNECTGCHQPMHASDFVYTIPISTARLPASLPYQPFDWNAITMFVDPKTHEMAMLFGNGAGIRSLVTWEQREDPHWFGGRIPGEPRSVEFVQATEGQPPTYRRFAGTGLAEEQLDPKAASARTDFVMTLHPAWLP